MVPTGLLFNFITNQPIATSFPTVRITNTPSSLPTIIKTNAPIPVNTRIPTIITREPTVVTEEPTIIQTNSPTTTNIVSKSSTDGAPTLSQTNTSNNLPIIISISLIVLLIIGLLFVCLFKKQKITQMDAYRKWTTFYDSKSKNAIENKDIHHFYSKNTINNQHYSPYVSPRQSINSSRITMRGQSHESPSHINRL
jgi:hypothetical protein